MTIPKYIQKLLERQREYGKMIEFCHSKIINFAEKNDIDILELETYYGCMITTEPDCYYKKWKELIESKE